jgi:hypothetical protein
MGNITQRILGCLLATILLFYTTALPAGAHGDEGAIMLNQAPVGPYTLTVRMTPAQIRPGEIYLAALVMDGAAPLVNGALAVEIIPVEPPGPPITADAPLPTLSHHFEHEVSVVLAGEGRYRVNVSVRDPAGKGGEAGFDITVTASSAWISALTIGQLLAAPVIGAWLLKEGIVAWRKQ